LLQVKCPLCRRSGRIDNNKKDLKLEKFEDLNFIHLIQDSVHLPSYLAEGVEVSGFESGEKQGLNGRLLKDRTDSAIII
jgi:hypothetical protein